jgi:aryl-alcohol dehydrogenase-like predicted oxidoreductase
MNEAPLDPPNAPGLDRRGFLKGAAFAGAATIGAGSAAVAKVQEAEREMKKQGASIPKKLLGKTGLQISAIGLGGFHLGVPRDARETDKIVGTALDAGITFFDNAWEYHKGESEIRLGAALKGKRDEVTLMTKVCTHGRGKAVAMGMLEDSLRRLQTDHLDIWQIHEVVYYNDPDLIFAPGGAAEALVEAKKQGKVRFVGFTGHKDPAIHLKMLAHDFPFDTVQMPLNCFDASYHSFEKQVLPVAVQRGIAVLGMKSLGGSGEMVTSGVITPEEGLRYAMSLPVATTISGVDSLAVLEQNLSVARGFVRMPEAEMEALRQRCRESAADGRFEKFKTTKFYDGDLGREQHGFPPAKELPL